MENWGPFISIKTPSVDHREVLALQGKLGHHYCASQKVLSLILFLPITKITDVAWCVGSRMIVPVIT